MTVCASTFVRAAVAPATTANPFAESTMTVVNV
jgi:hypothetical protein